MTSGGLLLNVGFTSGAKFMPGSASNSLPASPTNVASGSLMAHSAVVGNQVLDILSHHPDPNAFEPLILRPVDPKQKQTQRWRFTEVWPTIIKWLCVARVVLPLCRMAGWCAAC